VPWEPKAQEKRIDLNTGADLGWVLVGYHAPTASSEDHIPMSLIQNILSEGLSSRLFNEIREKKGLSYSIASVHPDLKGPGHFLTYVVTKPADTGKVRREILKQVEIMRKELLPASELAAAKEKLRGAFLLESETVQGIAFRLARAESIGLGYIYEENFERNLQKVTAEELRRVAATYLVSPTIIIARPAGRFYFDD
jgi:predicted Zn-dependent peptidase